MPEVTIERQQQVQVAYIAAMVVIVEAFLELIELAEHFVIGSLVVETGLVVEFVATVLVVVVELAEQVLVEYQMEQPKLWYYFGIASD